MKLVGKLWQRRILSLLGLLLIAGLTGCLTLLRPPAVSNINPHLLLGNPSQATQFNPQNYLISRPQYVLSYNRDKGIPNWVSWQLTQDWLGNLPRQPFTADTSLPSDWYRVLPADYTGSGFDRGHMIPAADRNKTEADARAVFLMTNILPQAPDNNQGPWERLESACRNLAQQGKELYIVAGSVGQGGVGIKGKQMSLAQGKVLVPAKLWKLIVILDRPGLDIAGITAQTPVIAVIMPNQQGIKDTSWQTYRTTIDQIEKQTGYDFLSNLPQSLQATLEAKAS
jgi:endonuclease G